MNKKYTEIEAKLIMTTSTTTIVLFLDPKVVFRAFRNIRGEGREVVGLSHSLLLSAMTPHAATADATPLRRAHTNAT